MALRRFHRWVGLGVSGFALILAITGTTLAVDPVIEAASTGSLTAPGNITVAELTAEIVTQVPSATRIEKSANHAITVEFLAPDRAGRVRFDPASMSVQPLKPASPVWTALKDLHRSFFMGDLGRAIAGVSALAMGLLSLSGVLIMKRRMGGWRAVLNPPKSRGAQRLHMDAVRLALPGLLIAGLTGVILSLVSFSVLPDGQGFGPEFPTLPAATPMAFRDMPVLKALDLGQLRELILPDPEFPGDPITLSTHQGQGFIDPATGEMAGFEALGFGAQVYEVLYLLHTGQGAWFFGVLLGLSMLATPFAIVSGVWMTLGRNRTATGKMRHTPAQNADTILLVGSEGDTTWGFATTLAKALSDAGQLVHLSAMDALEPSYAKAKRLIVLTATHGDGDAPASAGAFLDRLGQFDATGLEFTVLGFGDRQFEDFCQFAHDVEASLLAKDIPCLLPMGEIDRQDCLAFQRWGRDLGSALNIPLELNHQPKQHRTFRLRLRQNQKFGAEIQAPVSILRFDRSGWHRSLRYEAGDLLGVLVPGETRPRYYSIASSRSDGFLEICVRQHPGGLCSGVLTSLVPGDTVRAFIKPNPNFRPSATNAPLILIGAGAGLGPLMGFLRQNPTLRPAHLFWGGRHPSSDFLYQSELSALSKSGQLSALETAFSRLEDGAYVQDRLLEKADDLRQLISAGAEVLICGGSAMGRDVAGCFQSILAPLGLTVETLKSQKRYLEDVY